MYLRMLSERTLPLGCRSGPGASGVIATGHFADRRSGPERERGAAAMRMVLYAVAATVASATSEVLRLLDIRIQVPVCVVAVAVRLT